MRRAPCTIILLLVTTTLAAAQAEPAAALGQNDGMAASQWWQQATTFRSEHYDVRTDIEPAIAQALAGHLDRMYDHYGRVLSGLRTRRNLRLELLLFERQYDYNATLDSRYDVDSGGTGGMCVRQGGKVTLAVWRGGRPVEQLQQILQHEGFHQVARSLLGDIPVWADEGLAEMFQSAILLDEQVIFGEVPARYAALLGGAGGPRGMIRAVPAFFKIDHDDWMDTVNAGGGMPLYAQAWSIVHYLLYGDDGRHQPQFEQFLATLNTGQGWQSAFLNAFGTADYDALDRAWRDYLPHLQPTDLRETIRRMDFLAAGSTALREKGVAVASLDQLKDELTKLGFTHNCQLFGEPRTLRATESKSFVVPGGSGPGGEMASATAVFELIEAPRGKETGKPARKPAPPKRAPAPTRTKKPAAGPPDLPDPPPDTPPDGPPGDMPAAVDPATPPMMIVTRGLKPLELQVSWQRDHKSGTWSYQISQR